MTSCPICNTSFDGPSCETCGIPADVGDDAGRWYDLGRGHWNAGRFGWASRCLERTVQIDPAMVKGWVALGIARRDSGEFLSAIECFDRAIAADPADDKAYYNKALTLEAHGIHRDALRVLDAGLERRPGSLVLLLGKADVLAKAERYEEALDIYDSALRIDPEYKVTVHARRKVADLLERKRQRERGGGLFRRRERSTAPRTAPGPARESGPARRQDGDDGPSDEEGPSPNDDPGVDGGSRPDGPSERTGGRGPDAVGEVPRNGGEPGPPTDATSQRPAKGTRETGEVVSGTGRKDRDVNAGAFRRE